jgi:precorrin-4/cobalt-precorrin-4 C11-methyltransferase
MKVLFVGAGPGDPELLTVKARRLLEHAALCVYAGSLVSPAVLGLLPPSAERHDSARMCLEEIVDLFRRANARGVDVVRLHTGEPALYGAIGEQMDACDRLGIAYEVVPGVSAFQAAAAALRVELTAPEIAQTVILTRTAGRTPMPAAEQLAVLAQSRATLCVFLSAPQVAKLAGELAGFYGPDCPAAVVYHASWPDETMLRGTLGDIAGRIAAEDRPQALRRTAMFLVGYALARPLPHASRLYNKAFEHGYRSGQWAVGGRKAPGLRPGDREAFKLSFAIPVRPMKLALISLSDAGARLLERLTQGLGGQARPLNGDVFLHAGVRELPAAARFEHVAELTREIFSRYEGLVYVAPAGVVVRAIAPLVSHKTSDPAVVVVDVGGRWAVSLLSGHEGGANRLAVHVANTLGAEPVISTASEAGRDLVVGVGCRRGTPAAEIVAAVRQALAAAGCDLAAVRLLASAGLKTDEAGLIEAARMLDRPLRLVDADEIRATVYAFQPTPLAQQKLDLPAVAEPTALLAGRRTRLLLPKQIFGGVTVAVARENCWSLASAPARQGTVPPGPPRPSPKAT